MMGAVVLRARVLPPVRAAHLRAATSESRYGHSVLLADPMVSPPHRTASRRRCSIALAGVCYVSAISQSQLPEWLAVVIAATHRFTGHLDDARGCVALVEVEFVVPQREQLSDVVEFRVLCPCRSHAFYRVGLSQPDQRAAHHA